MYLLHFVKTKDKNLLSMQTAGKNIKMYIQQVIKMRRKVQEYRKIGLIELGLLYEERIWSLVNKFCYSYLLGN